MCLFLERREHACERQRVSALNFASPSYKLCGFGQVDSVSESVSSPVKKSHSYLSHRPCGLNEIAYVTRHSMMWGTSVGPNNCEFPSRKGFGGLAI